MLPIREIWKESKTDRKASVEWWDSMAADFSKHQLPTAENSMTMRIIDREDMLSDKCEILDVGCGSGRYSVALAKRGARVSGVDISPKMIGFAKAAAEGLADVSFSVDDWHTLDLDEKGWNKKFDLVLANMTPAVKGVESFLKLSQASRNWCLLVKPSRRTNSVLDKLNEMTEGPRDTKALDETVAYAFDLLWQEGYCPKVEYNPEVWQTKKPLDEAIHMYTKRIESGRELNYSQRKAIREYLEKIAEDGFVEEITKTTIVAMYWQV